MHLNHVNLPVSDASIASEFLQKYFGLSPLPEVSANRAFAVLQDDGGLILTLMRTKRDTTPEWPQSFHVGFCVSSPAKVDEIYSRLNDDGVAFDRPSIQHGSWTFYFTAPGGFMVEVQALPDAAINSRL